jgi:DNA-binding transcriptional regulator/RsmH inhibitor MraZ
MDKALDFERLVAARAKEQPSEMDKTGRVTIGRIINRPHSISNHLTRSGKAASF